FLRSRRFGRRPPGAGFAMLFRSLPTCSRCLRVSVGPPFARWRAPSLAPLALVAACAGPDGARLLPGLLAAGDGLLRALARARVRSGALAVDGQAAPVTQALVAADLDLALDVGGDLAPQVALDLDVAVDEAAELGDLFVGQVTHARVARDADRVAHRLRRGASDPEDVGEGDLQPLLAGDVDSRDS